jgi:hypothetical protein
VFFIVVAICYYSYTHEKREDRGKKRHNLRSTIGFVFILIKWLWVVVFNYNKMLCATLLARTHILVHKHKPNNIKPSYISRQTKRTYSPTTNNQSPKLGKKITNNNQNVYYIWASFEVSKTKNETPKHKQKGWHLLNKKNPNYIHIKSIFITTPHLGQLKTKLNILKPTFLIKQMNQSQKGHMNSKSHDRSRIREKINDNDSSWQPKCNIFNQNPIYHVRTKHVDV